MIGAKSFAEFVAQRRIEELVHALGGVGAHHQRVAVGRRMCRGLGANVAAGAGLVVDIEGLAQRLGQLLGEVAGRHVGPLPRLVGNDDLHRLGGIGLGDCRRAGQQTRQHSRGACHGFQCHCFLSSGSVRCF